MNNELLQQANDIRRGEEIKPAEAFKLAKQNKNKKRSLEQLLELTKRFYVEKKLEKLRDDLEKLADEQEKLSEKTETENTKVKQDDLNKRFEDYKKELEELEKESKA